ncbi:uncharacterized protein LOC141850886 [Brevipalpus obovatus]|uniref:uncharacterized protein LOC141850886 n=1 Tax=Brevipalpus obovatus TaxID=246614 RepID=UPI003D9EFF05
MSTGEQAECRICLQSELVKNLLQPCLCKGSQQYAHGECLKQWMDIKRSGVCGVCKTIYSDKLFRKKPENFLRYLTSTEIAGEVLVITLVYGAILYLIIVGLSRYFSTPELISSALRVSKSGEKLISP